MGIYLDTNVYNELIDNKTIEIERIIEGIKKKNFTIVFSEANLYEIAENYIGIRDVNRGQELFLFTKRLCTSKPLIKYNIISSELNGLLIDPVIGQKYKSNRELEENGFLVIWEKLCDFRKNQKEIEKYMKSVIRPKIKVKERDLREFRREKSRVKREIDEKKIHFDDFNLFLKWIKTRKQTWEMVNIVLKGWEVKKSLDFNSLPNSLKILLEVNYFLYYWHCFLDRSPERSDSDDMQHLFFAFYVGNFVTNDTSLLEATEIMNLKLRGVRCYDLNSFLNLLRDR